MFTQSLCVCRGLQINDESVSFKTGRLKIGVKVKHAVVMFKVKFSREGISFMYLLIYLTVPVAGALITVAVNVPE